MSSALRIAPHNDEIYAALSQVEVGWNFEIHDSWKCAQVPCLRAKLAESDRRTADGILRAAAARISGIAWPESMAESAIAVQDQRRHGIMPAPVDDSGGRRGHIAGSGRRLPTESPARCTRSCHTFIINNSGGMTG